MPLAISTADALIVLAYVAATIALGVWLGRGNRSLEDYLLGGHTLPWWALLGSIVATETSTATFLSVPGLSFSPGGDLRFLQLAMGFILGRALVVVLLLPGYFRGNLLTAYALLQDRFGAATRRFASALFLVTRNLGDGLRLYLTAIALHAAMQLPMEACIVLLGISTMIYTLVGGMRSVVWNDCLQFIIYLVAAIATLAILSSSLPGGAMQIWGFAQDHGKLRVFDLSLSWDEPFTLWAGLIGGACLSLGTHGADQLIVQRCLAARNRRDAAKAMLASGLVVAVQFALFLAIGIGLASFFAAHPPSPPIGKGDEAYARFIVEQLPVGLVGLALAGVCAAAMSTLSSSLNTSAAALIGDFGGWLLPGGLSERRSLLYSRLFTVVFGGIQIAVALAAPRFSTTVVNDALAIAGFSAGVLLGVFLLGLLPLRITPAGALAGMICGLGILLLVQFGSRSSWPGLSALPFGNVAWPWFPAIGSSTTVAAGVLFSGFIFPEESRNAAS